MKEPIAQRTVRMLKTTGQTTIVHVAIGKPYKINEDSWGCPVEATGLHDKIPDIVGIDSFQSLVLSQRRHSPIEC